MDIKNNDMKQIIQNGKNLLIQYDSWREKHDVPINKEGDALEIIFQATLDEYINQIVPSSSVRDIRILLSEALQHAIGMSYRFGYYVGRTYIDVPKVYYKDQAND